MKDNFDLKKFLVENKSIEKYNPFFKKEKLNEGNVRDKIREMIINELTPKNPDYADYDEMVDFGDDESVEAQLGTNDYLIDKPSEEAPEEEETFIDPAGGIHDADEDDYAAMYLDEAKEDKEEETEEETEEEETEETEEEIEMPDVDAEAGGGLEDIAADMEGNEGDIMNHLMSALKVSKGMDNEKLTTQIGNTLKFFVGEYIGGEE